MYPQKEVVPDDQGRDAIPARRELQRVNHGLPDLHADGLFLSTPC